MSINSSSIFNSSFNQFFETCVTYNSSIIIIIAYSTTLTLLLLPLSIFVLYVGYQRWRKQRSATSHSDIFTYNMVAMEMVRVLGYSFFCRGVYTNGILLWAGTFMTELTICGQALFHCLTCVERYLAVVHPVTYMSLRQRGGVRIRNISIGCVWLLSLSSSCLNTLSVILAGNIYMLVVIGVSLTVMSVCSLSVLCVLIRSGPGEVGGDRGRVDQSKQRAFYTIMAILAALLLRFGGEVILTAMYLTEMISGSSCLVYFLTLWFSLPSSLVLPLLFLHRAGKLKGCKKNPESG